MSNSVGEAAITRSQADYVTASMDGKTGQSNQDEERYHFKNIWLFPVVASILILLIGISTVAFVSGYVVSG